jgi:D-sedoheptulose 7-phosphate isomerase
MIDTLKNNFEELKKILNIFTQNPQTWKSIESAGIIMSEAIRSENKIIACGNGGSMSDAMHFAEEMTGNFRKKRKAFPAIAISDPAYISCVANDYGFDSIFSRYIEALGKKGDVLFAISTSGNSENIVKGAEKAKESGLKVVGLTGKNGGILAGLCDVEIRVPYTEYSDRAQEMHIQVIHSLIHFVELKLV